MTPPSMLSYEFCALTDTGRVRANNEDAVAVHPDVRLALLADGMGGYNAGEVAAHMAVDQVGDAMQRWLVQAGPDASTTEVRRALAHAVDQANHAILGAALYNPNYQGMGTTLVVAVFCGDRLVLGHIGDSRCYRLRAGALRQITRDHSWLQEQIDAGLLTPQEAARSGLRNLVTRALGVEPGALMEINEFTVESGDLFILCSDGLTDMMGAAELTDLASQPVALAQRAERMVNMANALGGRDNISVLLAYASAAADAQRGLVSRLLHPH